MAFAWISTEKSWARKESVSLRIMLFTNHVAQPTLVQRLIHNDRNLEMWNYTRYLKSVHQHFFNLTRQKWRQLQLPLRSANFWLLSAMTRPLEVDAAANGLSIKCNQEQLRWSELLLSSSRGLDSRKETEGFFFLGGVLLEMLCDNKP